MSEAEQIECRPTKWFYLRAVAMVTMFAVFLVLFLKDWKIGWPGKNEGYYTFQAFKAAKEVFKEHEAAGRSAEAWHALASARRIGFPEEKGLLPSGVDPASTWPEILTDYEGYKKAMEEEGNKATPPLWAKISDERGWSSNVPEKSYARKKIKEQLYYGIGSGALMLVGLFFLVRTARRSMKVDGEAYYAPGGERVPFSSIRRIDKRKWETKGLAYLTYEAGEEKKKVKVDGMVYGQFKAEDGAPAEKLFERILENFSGELVELEADEDEAEDSAGEREGQNQAAKEGVEEPAENIAEEQGEEGDRE